MGLNFEQLERERERDQKGSKTIERDSDRSECARGEEKVEREREREQGGS